MTISEIATIFETSRRRILALLSKNNVMRFFDLFSLCEGKVINLNYFLFVKKRGERWGKEGFFVRFEEG